MVTLDILEDIPRGALHLQEAKYTVKPLQSNGDKMMDMRLIILDYFKLTS